MTLDALAILKFIWGFVSLMLMGLLKVIWSDFKKMQTQIEALEKEIIQIKAETVTKEKLDEILDRKMRPMQENLLDMKDNIANMRKDMKDDTSELKGDIQRLIRNIMDRA